MLHSKHKTYRRVHNLPIFTQDSKVGHKILCPGKTRHFTATDEEMNKVGSKKALCYLTDNKIRNKHD